MEKDEPADGRREGSEESYLDSNPVPTGGRTEDDLSTSVNAADREEDEEENGADTGQMEETVDASMGPDALLRPRRRRRTSRI